MKITAEQEKLIIMEILKKMNVSPEDAYIVAEATMDADLKGFSSHGIGRFPQYVKSLQNGYIQPQGEIEIESETVSTALINGKKLFGHVVTYNAMELALEKAKETGVSAIGIHNSNHFGVAGYYSDLAIMQDMVGIVMANTEPAVAPIGGKDPILGTNPISIGIPSNQNYVSVDMATSASARGKLLEAFRRGEEIPENVALDVEGNPTIDPEEALKGSILPFGAHKGYALAFMIEILAGPMVKAAYGKAVTGTANPDVICTKGDLIIVIDPSKFVDLEYFKDQVDEFIGEIKVEENVVIPGDMEVMNVKKHMDQGIEIDNTLYQQLQEISTDLNIDLDDLII